MGYRGRENITSLQNNNTSKQGCPLSLEEGFTQLLTLLKASEVPTLKNGDLPHVLVDALRDIHDKANNSESSKKVFEFAKEKQQEKLVKIVSTDIPDGILPKAYKRKLYDIKVDSKASDDKIYEEHPDIRENIPRGTTFIELEHGDNSMSELVVYANRKFTGGLGDENGDAGPTEHQGEECNKQELWRDYCLKDPDTAEKIVCTEKLNGEAAHFSGRYIEGQFYIAVGSKFVHMLIRDENDIMLYNGDRYKVARVVASSVCRAINTLNETQRKVLFCLLHQTKCTVVCELLQPENQHIVNLSDLSEPEIKCIFLTPTSNGLVSNTSLLTLPPHHAIDLLNALGLKSVNYEIKSASEGLQIRHKIRQEKYKEGEVLYYITASECTIGLVKTKTLWFIILRALREKATYCFTAAKKRKGWNLEDRIMSTLKRFKELQSWLKFSNDYLLAWEELARGLFPWLDEEIRAGRQFPIKIRPLFPIIWDKFLRDTNRTDDITLCQDYEVLFSQNYETNLP